ncbi:MAG: serpin family protein [Symploca sp. SIO3C6]|nr:serpin family protein [Symploca sp. SIO3C6]
MNRQIVSRAGVIVGAIAAAGIVVSGILEGLMAHKLNALDPLFDSQNLGEYSLAQESPDLAVDSQLIEANTKFGFKLLKEILKEESNKNVFISPSSIAIALAMTYNGASGETQQAMAKALELQGMSIEQINQANEALKVSLENADPEVQLSIANSLWSKLGIEFQPDFLQRNQQFYGAQVKELDFNSPDAPRAINKWVQENTSGKIDKIIDQIKPNDLLFLINAIYFKGNWSEKFDQNLTTELPFYLLDGTQKQHPLMFGSGKYNYYENETFQAASLPYGEGRLSFYVFLPHQSITLEAFEQQLNAQNWQQWMDQFRKRKGMIKLPRFKFEYDIQLNNALRALGMEVAFSPRANFADMTFTPVAIDEVKHKTFVEVNEEGTEAAAITSIGITRTSAETSTPPFQMIVDRPFFCAIRDNQTGTVLFMGSIVEPN